VKQAHRILLVEDNAEDVLFFKRALAQAGVKCAIETAPDGQRAVEQLTGGDTSHVLLDLKLPRKSGLEVLEWMRSQPRLRELPVIVLTSSELRDDHERAEALGIDGYFVKPVSTKGLVEIVRAIANRWKIPAENADH
jgi:CheY-like chemotaxis protein